MKNTNFEMREISRKLVNDYGKGVITPEQYTHVVDNLPKSVRNEVIEARCRKGAFEKNNALKRQVMKNVTGSHIQTAINWVVGLSIIFVIVYFTIIAKGGY